ncbi:helix-turn-helix transcriptional regulator [Kineosporia succinea]|uniref:DNA-binding CsgD family transcriptional regulator n=1 Tax=Kineosporia succinea TaxID=84632 RepID=A0ABT9PFJ0_9ACTN|nr:LuxR family transcriptional regulator [Kineosporia succinea]MDP9830940.1 DNA-binding CsgD family transcriptional regulator [Kineosporia succinea]
MGREEEYTRVTGLLADRSRPVLLLRGDAGLGKTALLEALAAEATDFRVLRCAGSEAESDLTYAGLHQLLFPLLPSTAGLGPEHRAVIDVAFSVTSGASPTVMALGIAVLELLVLDRDTPLLLLVDDGHWLDEPSARVLAFVARRLSGTAIRMAVALRTGQDSPLDGAGLPELGLEPLTPEASARLLDRRWAGLSAGHRALVLQTAAGNPLALLELPRAPLLAPGAVGLPRRLEQMFGARLRELPPGERRELLRAALDGAGSAHYRLRDVGVAGQSGLLAPDPATGEMTFQHPLARSAVVQAASPEERRAVHLDLAERHRDDPERRAVHLAAATVEPDDEVAAALDDAAASATRRGGATVAVTWLTRAAELSRRPGDRSRRLAEAAYLAGQAGALDAAQDLAEQVGSDDPAAVVSEGYIAFYRDGDTVRNHHRICTLLESGTLAEPLARRALGLLLPMSQFAGDPARWHRTEVLFARFPELVEEPSAIALDAWGDTLRRGHDVPRRIREVLAGSAPVGPWESMRLMVSASSVGVLGEHRAFLRRAVEREGDDGAVTTVMVTLQMVMLDEFWSGDWAQAEATGRRGLDLTLRHGYQMFAQTFHAYLGLLAAFRGEVEPARALQASIDSWGRPRGLVFFTDYAAAIGAATAMGAGDPESAYAYATAITEPGTFAPYSQLATRTLLDLVESAWHTGRTEQARRHAEAARDAGLLTLSPRLGLLTAGALAITADPAAAREMFEAAVSHPAGPDHPFEHARIQLAQGVRLRRTRETGAARRALAGALGTFERLGAAAWAERTRAELRATGPGGGQSLTPQERQIAELAAGGLSNKEIGARLYLSPRTVGAHLYKIFPKLGVSSRASLRDALGREQTPDKSSD